MKMQLTHHSSQGGFARVYEVQDQRATRRAVKVVSKASIKTKKNKTKVSGKSKLLCRRVTITDDQG